jgi:hypothetical protein
VGASPPPSSSPRCPKCSPGPGASCTKTSCTAKFVSECGWGGDLPEGACLPRAFLCAGATPGRHSGRFPGRKEPAADSSLSRDVTIKGAALQDTPVQDPDRSPQGVFHSVCLCGQPAGQNNARPVLAFQASRRRPLPWTRGFCTCAPRAPFPPLWAASMRPRRRSTTPPCPNSDLVPSRPRWLPSGQMIGGAP